MEKHEIHFIPVKASERVDIEEDVTSRLWDNVLYPQFRATIRGEYYGRISYDAMDEECYYLARRAINAFKFPKISTNYTPIYAIRGEDTRLGVNHDENSEELILVSNPELECAIPHAYFNETLTDAEIEIIVAWMKVYWCENQISNADNFEDMYTDANIKTYSRANVVDKNLKLFSTYRDYARDLENRYSRVTSTRKSSIGGINSDE